MFLDNDNYKLLLIIPCKIENMAYNIYIAITLEKSKIIFFKFQNCSRISPYIHQEIWVQRYHTVVEKLHFVRWGILI